MTYNYFHDARVHKFYRLGMNGFFYRWSMQKREWINESGKKDITLEWEILNEKRIATVMAKEYTISCSSHMCDKYEKKDIKLPSLLGDFSFFLKNDDVAVLDCEDNQYYLKDDCLQYIKKKNVVNRKTWEPIPHVLLFDFLNNTLGEYSISQMELYSAKDNTIHCYDSDKSHFIYSSLSNDLIYIDDNEVDPSFTKITINEDEEENDIKFDSVPRNEKKNYVALTTYLNTVRVKYNDTHKNEIPFDLLFFRNYYGKVYAKDNNGNIYECTKTTIKPLAAKKGFNEEELKQLRNCDVIQMLELYKKRKSATKKGQYTFYDFEFFKDKEAVIRGLTEEGEVYLLNEDGEFEKDDSYPKENLKKEDHFDNLQVCLVQSEKRITTRLKPYLKAHFDKLREQGIDCGSKCEFYESSDKEDPSIYAKDDKGLEYKSNSRELELINKGTIKDDFRKIESFIVARHYCCPFACLNSSR